MDKLDEMIAAAAAELSRVEAEISGLQSRRDLAAFRLATLKAAAEARPPSLPRSSATARPHAEDGSPKRSGRQPGAITGTWKRIVVNWFERDQGRDGLDYAAIQKIAREQGVDANLHSIRDRVRKYRDKLEIIEEIDGRYRVTEAAYRRYREQLGPSSTSDSAPEVPQGAGLFSDQEEASNPLREEAA